MFFKQPLVALMLCSHWSGRCVLMGALVFFQTTPFGTYAVFSLVGTLCTDGSPCLFHTTPFGTDAVFSLVGTLCTDGGPCVFFEHPPLALMRFSHWWGHGVLLAGHSYLNNPFWQLCGFLIGGDAVS